MYRDESAFEMPPRSSTSETDIILKENQARNMKVSSLMDQCSRDFGKGKKDGKPGSNHRILLDTPYVSIISSILDESHKWNTRFATRQETADDLCYARLDWNCKNLKEVTGRVPSDDDFQELRREIKSLLDRDVPQAQEQLHSICQGKNRLDMQFAQLGSRVETIAPERGTEPLQMPNPVPEHLTFTEQLHFINEACGNVDIPLLQSLLM